MSLLLVPRSKYAVECSSHTTACPSRRLMKRQAVILMALLAVQLFARDLHGGLLDVLKNEFYNGP